jgi:poly(glycerol-phosphate) alpha-glucosyltransferase
MKVLALVDAGTSGGGLATATGSLYRSLVHRGVDVEVVSPRPKGDHQIDASFKGLKVITYKSWGTYGASSELAKIIRGQKPTVIHLHGLWTFPHQLCAYGNLGANTPIVISPHGMMDQWAMEQSRIRKRVALGVFGRRAFKRAACLHALNDAEFLAIRTAHESGRIAVIPNGVDLPRPVERSRAPSVQPFVLFLGRLHKKKGIEELISAWGRRSTTWRLIIAGWGDHHYETQLRQSLGQVGDQQIEFLGPVFGAEKDELLSHAEAFILPSFSEGLPMAILEAWAAGLPVLMSDNCNVPEGYAAKAALRLEPTIDSIASALDHLEGLSSEQRRSMGQRGRALVEEKFARDKVAHAFEDMYEWVQSPRSEVPRFVR